MDVVAAEGPIHVELAARRWGQTVGYRRVSKRIYDGFIQTVVGDAKKRGLIELRGKFIWLPKTEGVRVRDRSSLDTMVASTEESRPEKGGSLA